MRKEGFDRALKTPRFKDGAEEDLERQDKGTEENEEHVSVSGRLRDAIASGRTLCSIARKEKDLEVSHDHVPTIGGSGSVPGWTTKIPMAVSEVWPK